MNNRILYTPKEKKQFRTQKSRYRLYLIIGIVGCVTLLIAALFGVRMSAFQIEKISINGINAIREDDMRQEIASVLAGSYLAGLIPYRFFLAVPIPLVAQHIKDRFSLVAEIEIKKLLPRELTIMVKERELFGVLCHDGANQEVAIEQDRDIQCVYLDTKGVAYQKAPKTHGFLLMKISTDTADIPLGQQVIHPILMRRMIELNQKLPLIIGSSILGYRLSSQLPHEVRAVSKQGFSLLVNEDGDLDNLLYVLKTVLIREIGSKRANLDYIDLRFGNKVFYKYKGM